MNREIIFRGKRVDNDEWVYGFLRCRNYIDVWTPHTWKEEDGSAGEYATVESYQVKSETVGQFTGLVDKNGKKIFEGDILKGCWKMIFEVYYDDCLLQFRAKTVDGFNNDIDYYGYPHQIEVIGNIYNNPELLEAEND